MRNLAFQKCDGELSRTQIARKGAELNRRLRDLQDELGRKVTEGEAYGDAR